MAIGKNKRISKGKKGSKKKAGDPFLKKEWYDVRAPSTFQVRNCGKTLVSKTQGTKLAVDGLKGRVFEVNLADLSGDEEQGYRKIKLSCEDVQGKNCLTDFHGMDMTRNKLCSLIRKWQSLIESFVDVKTADGYQLRVFCIAFTQRRKNQVKSTCYARSSQIRQIRKKTMEIVAAEAQKSQLRALVKTFILSGIESQIERACKSIFPLQDVFVRKVKVLKKPKFDLTKLMELHGDIPSEDKGKAVAVEESAEAGNVLAAEMAATS